MIICKYCKHFLNKEPDSPRSSVWYNHLCKASPLELATDPVTGEQGYLQKNSLGMAYVTSDQFQFCREVNHGDCDLFESAIEWQVAGEEADA